MLENRRIRCALLTALALTLPLACGDGDPALPDAPPPGPTDAPEVDLGSVHFPEQGLPDPCEVLRAAATAQLLVRPLEEEPMRVGGMCLLQVDRAGRPEPQTSAALELDMRELPQPESLDDYFAQYGEGVNIAGAEREDVEMLPGLGEFAVWFPHADGALTLSAFWAGDRFLSIEVHGVEQEIAHDWAKEVAAEVIRRAPGSAATEGSGAAS